MTSLDNDSLEELKKEVKSRNEEIDLLNAFISKDGTILSPAVIISGYKAVGKSYTVDQYLKALNIKNTIIKCDECISQKLLLQRCLKRIMQDSGVEIDSDNQLFNYKGQDVSRIDLLCENFASFISSLDLFIEETNYQDTHVLVLDRFDQCIDSSNELFPSFLRLHEHSQIKNLSIIFIISHEDPREVVTASVPHIHFKPYTQDQVVEILQSKQLCFFGVDELDGKVGLEFWKQYAKIITDLFFTFTGPDMTFLIDICNKLWNEFVDPVLQGKYKPNEFLKLYRESKGLFTNDNIINNSSIQEYNTFTEEEERDSISVQDLPYHSKFILIASYLASFVEPKSDLVYFSKMKTIKNRSGKYNKKKTTLSKSDIDNRLLSPNYFDLERLRAILSVIYRNESESLNKSELELQNIYQDMSDNNSSRKDLEFSKFTLNSTIDVNSQIATLASLGLITRTYALDILSSKIRWKCNISWATVQSICKDINFPILNYLADN